MGKNGSAAKGPQPDTLTARLGRHRRAVAGAVGVLAVAGIGIATSQPDKEPHIEAASGVTSALASSTAPSAPASAAASTSGTVEPPATATEAPAKANKLRIKDMKGAVANAYAAGELVHPPRRPAYTGPTVPATQITEEKVGDIRKDRSDMRIVSARGNLTGQGALAWVVDDGEKVGHAHCTQKIQLSNNPKPKVRPTLLLCWRTSATRSVYTLAVNLDGPPSKKASIAALEKAWAKLA